MRLHTEGDSMTGETATGTYDLRQGTAAPLEDTRDDEDKAKRQVKEGMLKGRVIKG